jgi:hypothetical protein
MCWFSAHHAERILQAEAGQRLVIRKVHGRSWAVQESDLDTPRPTPVCLVDRTRVLFRFSDLEQAHFAFAPETEAVFRISTNPQRDVFQFSDGREADVDTLPVNLRFDVLEIPGKEELSAILKDHRVQRDGSSILIGMGGAPLEPLPSGNSI